MLDGENLLGILEKMSPWIGRLKMAWSWKVQVLEIHSRNLLAVVEVGQSCD